MRYAETGYNLEIDLSQGNIEKVETDRKLMELHLGGQGTAAKILWDRVSPEAEPFSPENLLIFSAGLFSGTSVPGANRTSVTTINPQTNLYSHSAFGGYFGPELKRAGYDEIVVGGKSPNLVYLYINNDQVEIRDATHLQGKGPLQTAAIIQEELNEPKAQVAAIGLAGENRVYMASIGHANAWASRGVGSVMGDKMLKAIVVRGTKDINVARQSELSEICTRQYQEIQNDPEAGDLFSYENDYAELFHLNNFAWGNARKRIKNYWNKELEEEWRELSNRVRARWVGCDNCPKNCYQEIHYPGRQPYFQICYTKLTYAMAAYEDLKFNYDILGVTYEYGLDGLLTPQVLAFAVELYDAGILTDNDLPGFPTDSAGRFFYLVEKIVQREGVGDALANGVYWAARQIGKGAEVFDHNTIKKFEQMPLKLGKVNLPYFVMYATGEKLTITQTEGAYPQAPEPDPEERKRLVDGWVAAPERFKKWFLEWEPRQEQSIEESVNIVDWNEIMHYVDDAIGTCAFLSSFRGQIGCRPSYHIYNLPEFISLATGMDIDSDGLWEVARRNRNLIRSINVRRGLRRVDEAPPADHWKVRDPEMEQKVLDAFYEFKGWDREGIPTKKTLDYLGLDYVSEDFEKRGLYTK